ncbi:flocculation protein FLO11 [Drosophila obscura]|uniref:flocculation protein FLO11 n=1 Tax=Drosophila obscura TaxID=7282 RepID=UPI001BB1AD24|nr:flocculation protein FLO11 [Drosophila obscura]
MQLTLTFPVISLWLLLVLLVVGARAQDIRPEFPEDFPRPTTEEAITTTEEGTAEEPTTATPTEEPFTSASAEEATTPASAEEATTSGSAEEAMSAGSAEEATTPAPPEKTATTTKEPSTITTTTKEPITTTTTEAPKTTQATEAPPIYTPPYAPPTIANRPTYTTRNPWILNEQAERCYLRDQRDYGYRNGGCGPWGWRSTISCYRCCYFASHNVAGCSKLHRGRCGYY